ncbi:leucyl aminopeptidase family protein [Patescibacteria group bacterium]|nr:leucyl aminopeptidase family protein [Patescibacteria group bacterium]
MDNFYKNKVDFKVKSEGRIEGVVIVPFVQKEDILKTAAVGLIEKKSRDFLKTLIKKIPKLDFNLIDLGTDSILLIKIDKETNWRIVQTLIRQALRFLKENNREKISFCLADWKIQSFEPKSIAELIVSNSILADFDFSRYYKTEPKDGWTKIKSVSLFVRPKDLASVRAGIKSGILIGQETNRARFLSNLPGGDLKPSDLVAIAQSVSREVGLKIKVLNAKNLEKIKAGGLLGVGRGSKDKPYLIIIEPREKQKRAGEFHFIGKGITFDTGGLHIKVGENMKEMQMDMSGAASVLAASALIAQLKIPINFVTLIPTAENMISGESYRPGDILKSLSGQSIEVGSPDAEGRIVLADAITYGKKFYQPNLIVDNENLTGASMIALGTKTAALFTSNNKIEPLLRRIGESSGDYVWPLPMGDEYAAEIKAPFADVLNIGKTRYGGATAGAMFLWHFAQPTDFVHLDIAPRMTADESDQLNQGSVGFGVRYLKELAEAAEEFKDVVGKK